MKVIILAGGLGTRIMEESTDKPKPMTVITDKPIISHIMDIYRLQGFNEFIFALGYKSEVIKRWLIDSVQLAQDFRIDFQGGKITSLSNTPSFDSIVQTIDTGLNTQTGGRIAKCIDRFPNETLMATYGDGLANVNLNNLIEFHRERNTIATLTAVRPPARFGYIKLAEKGGVTAFGEKNQSDEGWINGGFFVLEPEVRDYIFSDDEPFETGALPRLASEGQLSAYCHDGFWQPMDTLREKHELEKLSQQNPPPWLRI